MPSKKKKQSPVPPMADAYENLLDVIDEVMPDDAPDYIELERVADAISPFLRSPPGAVSTPETVAAYRRLVEVLVRVCVNYERGSPLGFAPRADEPYDEYDGDTLSAEPPPLAQPIPLDRDEITWVLKWAKERASAVGAAYEIGLGCCAAGLLPYFKYALRSGYPAASIKRHQVVDCAEAAWPGRLWEPETIAELTGLFRMVSGPGTFRGVMRAASYQLTQTPPFSAESPTVALDPGNQFAPDVRYAALCMASVGEDWTARVGVIERADLCHLTVDELKQVYSLFEPRLAVDGFDAVELGLFVANLLPRLKWSANQGHPYALLRDSDVDYCLSTRRDLAEVISATAVLEPVPGWTNPFRSPYLALRLRPGSIVFSADAPRGPIHLRTGDMRRRWESVRRAAHGLEARKF